MIPAQPITAAKDPHDNHRFAETRLLERRTRHHAPYLGGTRRWFVCPVTGARCRILYLVEGQWISRRAFRGAYPSQRISARERRAREAVRWVGAVGVALEA